MGYYGRGDYYRGDYYRRGDLWGTIKSGISGFISGGPIGALTGLIRGAMPGTKVGPIQVQGPGTSPVLKGALGGALIGARGGVPGALGGALAGGALGFGSTLLGPSTMAAAGSCAPGWHLNKADSPKGKKGTYCVRNRSMAATNPRALRRAIRREKGFIAVARRALRGTGVTIGRSRGFASKKRAK